MQLNYGNYEWWWRSFYVGGSGGFYMFAYSIYYLLVYMRFSDLTTDATFSIYVVLMIFMYSCAAGTLATQASYLFVKNIY